MMFSALALALAGGQTLRATDSAKVPSLKLEIDSAPIDRDVGLRVSFAPVVKKASQSVVYVSSSKKVRHPDMSQFFNDPTFRHFFGTPGQGQGQGQGQGGGDGTDGGDGSDGSGGKRGGGRFEKEESLGSGVIVSADGYILTNNHVVDGADDIQVKFGVPEKSFKATVVGRDAEADVAVLKIDAKGLIPAILGDSDQLLVGDTVLAIGDPFGIGLTVTHGIVSALGRNNLSIEAFEDFIQTDAPINPGNSGGALLDSQGRVVGINTAILSHSGGSNGVGFAIPINLVRSLAQQLIDSGKVARGYLGVVLQEITPDLAAQFGSSSGALVSDLRPGGPAEKAGLKSGDIIIHLNGKPVEDYHQLRLSISELAPGSAVALDYLRDGKVGTIKITLGELPSKERAGDNSVNSDQGVLNGVGVGDITSEVREQMQLPPRIQGAVITEVEPDSASARAGLVKGDVILELDRKPVSNADEAVKLSAQIKGPKVLVRLWRQGSIQFIVVDETQK